MAKRMRKFLCDQMCAELGRWLRAAGFDTAIIDTALEDQKILSRLFLQKLRKSLYLKMMVDP